MRVGDSDGRRAAGLHNRASAFGFWTQGNCLKVEPEHVLPARRTIAGSVVGREALAGLAASGAISFAREGDCSPAATEAKASAALVSFGEHLLALGPEGATSLGLDTGERVPVPLPARDRRWVGSAGLRT